MSISNHSPNSKNNKPYIAKSVLQNTVKDFHSNPHLLWVWAICGQYKTIQSCKET